MPSWFHSAFGVDLPLIEKIVRPIVVYAALVGLLRLFGKRELAQLNSLDLVVLLSLSNTVQNAIIGNDNSITGGLIGAFSLLAVNYLVGWLLYRKPRLDRMLEGAPTVLVDQGKVNRRGMESEFLTHGELMTVLHRQGFERLDEVERCVLEPGGTFFIKRKGQRRDEQERAEILKRIDELKAKLDALAASAGNAGNV
jgi:uncharacterized membrane protein YcaP (DUF421 family)